MAIEDLDLEFEDDEGEKTGIIDVGSELSFGPGEVSKREIPPQGRVAPSSPAQKVNALLKNPKELEKRDIQKDRTNPNNVADLARRRAQMLKNQVSSEVSRPPSSENNSTHLSDDSSFLMNELLALRSEVKALKDEMNSVKIDSEVRARVAEEKSKFMIEYITEAKLTHHQLTQILQRIHTKVPGLKNEVLMAKKILDEFLKKKEDK